MVSRSNSDTASGGGTATGGGGIVVLEQSSHLTSRKRRRKKQTPHGGMILLWVIRSLGGLVMLSTGVTVYLHYGQLPHPTQQLSEWHFLLPPNNDKQQQQQQQQRNSSSFRDLWGDHHKKAQQVITKDKRGGKKITAMRGADLEGIGDDQGVSARSGKNLTTNSSSSSSSSSSTNLTVVSLEAVKQSRKELLDILEDAGVTDIDAESLAKLPTWEQVRRLYYDTDPGGPVIYGLETCQAFRDRIPKHDAMMAPAGLFNTGTNPLAMYLMANCEMPDNTKDAKFRGMKWQVPWGKHMLAKYKWNNTANHDDHTNKTNVLPIVLIRDPYSWMQSMCKHSYAANWFHRLRCPNLVVTENDRAVIPEAQNDTFAVTIRYPIGKISWPSLADVWSDWYNQYLQADYPRLIVRFEDLIFQQKKLIGTICECAGAVPKTDSFSYVVGAGKWGKSHTGSSNMVSAMIKYGSDKKRFAHLTTEDLAFASKHVDANLLHLFHYNTADIPVQQG